MFFSEIGQFHTTYEADAAILRLRQHAMALAVLAVVAFGVVPLAADDYWLTAILTPFLILSLAGIGLNMLTGYAGQLSVGTAGFMSVGAYAAYNIGLRVPGMPIVASILAGGLAAAALGVVAGLPSARIKGFYLVVSTLAVQFFVEWLFTRFRWFSNDNASGQVSAPPLLVAGVSLGTPAGRYLLTLVIVAGMTLLAANIARSDLGRQWMAVRDMDTAAAVIGIPVRRVKLVAFAVSSFYCGVAGALWGIVYLGSFDPRAFDLSRSFQVLFIIIVGGLGTVSGGFLGAAFMVLLPIAMSHVATALFRGAVDQGALENYKKIAFGVLIVVVLVKEPGGLAKILQRLRAQARVWPLRAW